MLVNEQGALNSAQHVFQRKQSTVTNLKVTENH